MAQLFRSFPSKVVQFWWSGHHLNLVAVNPAVIDCDIETDQSEPDLTAEAKPTVYSLFYQIRAFRALLLLLFKSVTSSFRLRGKMKWPDVLHHLIGAKWVALTSSFGKLKAGCKFFTQDGDMIRFSTPLHWNIHQPTSKAATVKREWFGHCRRCRLIGSWNGIFECGPLDLKSNLKVRQVGRNGTEVLILVSDWTGQVSEREIEMPSFTPAPRDLALPRSTLLSTFDYLLRIQTFKSSTRTMRLDDQHRLLKHQEDESHSYSCYSAINL